MVPVFVKLRGGEQKCTKKNRTPLARSTIEPSVQNGFCRPSGKRLQLEMWDVNSRGIDRPIKRWENQARPAADFVILGLANTPEAILPLIKRWNFPTYTFSVSSIIVRILPSAERLSRVGACGLGEDWG